MIMSDSRFNKLRYYAEVIGYVLAFILAVSDIVGFKYGSTLGAIIAAFNYMVGKIIEAARKAYANSNPPNYISESEDENC